MSTLSSHHSPNRRVVIVGYRGLTVMDTYVKPTLPITDYRTKVTGIVEADLLGEL